MYYIGIDLGGTNIAAGLVDEAFHIIGRGKMKTNLPRPADDIVADMAKTARMAALDAGVDFNEVRWVGVGCPGTVNKDTGLIEYSNNLDFHHLPLQDMLREALGKEIYIDNDANAAAYGEALAGAATGASISVAMTLGTGVGGGIVIDGRIYSGFNFAGAELGHSVIVVDGEHCTCGRNGCLEAYASATALIRQTKDAMEQNPQSAMWKIAEQNDGKVSGRTAFDAMRQGDAAGKAVVDQYIRYVACGVTNIINIFQPEVLTIGGGISKEGDTLLVPLREQVEKERYSKYAKKQTEIRTASLGNDAGIIGAAFLGNSI